MKLVSLYSTFNRYWLRPAAVDMMTFYESVKSIIGNKITEFHNVTLIH